MRQVASFLLIVLALPAMATEAWRWKDANGVVHYADRPVPGAERVKLAPETAPAPNTAATAKPQAPPMAQPATPVRYISCIVLAPVSDEVFNAVNSVNASVRILPGLQPGHRMQVTLDGKPHPDWASGLMSYKLEEIHRGSHTLAVQVLDADGRTVCDGPPVTFHVRQPSIYSPARQPLPKPPAPKAPKP